MALVLADRVRQTTTTTGQGTITLNGTVTGFQSFSAIGNGNTTYYAIVGQNSSEWEVGIGTYTSSGTTLSRDTVLSSSAGGTTKTTFSAGTKDVFVTYPAARSVYSNGTNIVPDSTATLLATSGGTGQSSYAVGDLLYASTTTALSKLADVDTGNALISGGVGVAPSYGKIGLTTHVSGTLPVANGGTGITSFGTGVATALGVNTGSSGAFVVNGGDLGTPSSGTVTNMTGTASININGTVGATTANTGAFTTLSATGVTTVQAGAVSAPAITTSGDTNTGIFFPAADTIAFSEGGAEVMRLDSSANLQFNSGYGSVATAYGCRAWVNFNGTGTVAIRASGNVSSITDNGTGQYTINFTTAMPDANYAAIMSSSQGTGTGGTAAQYMAGVNLNVAPTTSAVTMLTKFCRPDNSGFADVDYNYVSIIR
jgi:hypothetical protein